MLTIEQGQQVFIPASATSTASCWPPPSVQIWRFTLDESFAYARHIKLEAKIAAMQAAEEC